MNYKLAMDVRYEITPGASLNAESVLVLLGQAGIENPCWSAERMDRALRASSVVVCAWQGSQLVGFARVISDFAWIAYLSQLAVKPEIQDKGIGKRLIELILKEIGDEVSLVVHSGDSATKFYQSANFLPYSNVYSIKRKR